MRDWLLLITKRILLTTKSLIYLFYVFIVIGRRKRHPLGVLLLLFQVNGATWNSHHWSLWAIYILETATAGAELVILLTVWDLELGLTLIATMILNAGWLFLKKRSREAPPDEEKGSRYSVSMAPLVPQYVPVMDNDDLELSDDNDDL